MKYDRDEDGTISMDELIGIFRELGHEPSEELLAKLDPDGSGNVTFVEFINGYEIWEQILRDAEDQTVKEELLQGRTKVRKDCSSRVNPISC